MAQEVEETMKRIQSHKGVVGTIVVNAEGIPIKSTLDNTTTVQYAGLISQLSDKARSVVRDLDPTNDLTFLRIRSKKHEIMVAPDKEFILIVIQNPVDWCPEKEATYMEIYALLFVGKLFYAVHSVLNLTALYEYCRSVDFCFLNVLRGRALQLWPSNEETRKLCYKVMKMDYRSLLVGSFDYSSRVT